MVRAEGLVRIRDLHLPLLRRASASLSAAVTDAWPVEVENLLRAAVSRLGGGELQEAAAYTLGLGPGMRDRPAADRRRLAAKVYSVSVERFRKSQEAAGTTADRDVHLVVRRPLIADLVADVLGAEQQPLTAAELPSGEERGHRCG